MRVELAVAICHHPTDGDALQVVRWRTGIKPPGEDIEILSLPNGRVVFPAETAVLVCDQGHLRAELVMPVAGEVFPINLFVHGLASHGV